MLLQCENCLTEGPESRREANDAGWKDIHRVPKSRNLLDWNTHTGVCPRCVVEEDEMLYEQAVRRGEKPPKPLLVRSAREHCCACSYDGVPKEYQHGSPQCAKCGSGNLEMIFEANDGR